MIKHPNWKHIKTVEIPEPLKPWIENPESFMQYVLKRAHFLPSVQVLTQAWERVSAEESALIQQDSSDLCYVREVLITLKEKTLMFAQTIFPVETIKASKAVFCHLENQSLGSILFADPSLKRTDFEVAPLEKELFLHKKLAKVADISVSPVVWGRRSVFYWQGNPLLLNEFFLPDMWTL